MPKLTKELTARICERIRQGAYLSPACEAEGVPDSTGSEWLQRGRGEHSTRRKTPVHAEFAEAIKKAEAECEQTCLLRIQTAAAEPRTWQAAAWLLERRFPQRWVKHDKPPAQGETLPVCFEFSTAVDPLDEDAVLAEAAAIRARRLSEGG